MSSPFEKELRSQLTRYIQHEIELDDFESWFVGTHWTLDRKDPAGDLVAEVELRLAELSRGHVSEKEFRATMAAALQSPTTSRT